MICAWCEEQGAICFSELVENRDELVSAPNAVFSSMEIGRLQSSEAVEAAEQASVAAHCNELASLLTTIVARLEVSTLKSIEVTLGSAELLLLSEARRKTRGKLPQARESCKLTADDHRHGQISVLEKSPKSGVKTTASVQVSKRDKELLQLAASKCVERCEACGVAVREAESQATGDDGCLYCARCWANWWSSLDSENQEHEGRPEAQWKNDTSRSHPEVSIGFEIGSETKCAKAG